MYNDKRKKIALLSNYSWPYMSAEVAKRYFPNDNLTLITKKMPKVIVKRHDFGMEVIELSSAGSTVFKNIRFDTLIIDQGFSLQIAILLLTGRFKEIFLIDLDKPQNPIQPITRLIFLKNLMMKLPYFLNKILSHISKKLKLSVCFGQPSEIFIETAAVCNLKCKACPTGLGQLNRPCEFMAPQLFNEMVKNNRRNFKYLDIVNPFLFGEPLLNKHIFEYIKILRKETPPYTRIELHTNGNIDNSRDAAAKLVETGLDMVSISLDGADCSSYESFRQGGNFALACEFIKALTKAKKEKKFLKPEIVIQMILTRYSEDQIDAFKRLRDELGVDRILFKEYFHEFTMLTDREGYALAPTKKELSLTEEEKKGLIDRKKNLCGWVYRTVCISSNGEIAPCCIDFNISLLGGLNVRASDIRKLWNSEKYKRLRKDMLSGSIDMCNKCFLGGY